MRVCVHVCVRVCVCVCVCVIVLWVDVGTQQARHLDEHTQLRVDNGVRVLCYIVRLLSSVHGSSAVCVCLLPSRVTL